MSRKIYRAEGPDVEIIRQQLAVNPPDPGTDFDIEHDEQGTATFVWTSRGQRCSVGTAFIVVDE